MSNSELLSQAGQRIAVGFAEQDPHHRDTKELLYQIADGLLGGVIFFKHNFSSAEQAKELVSAFSEAPAPRPLFLMVDQEGGRVQRLASSNGFHDYPSQKQLAANPESIKDNYSALAQELKSLGLNFNFAPCIDIDFVPPCPVIGELERSFSTDSGEVCSMARAAIESMRAAGILSCIKHFPGHGSASKDSHKGLVDITESWKDYELEPYKQLLDSGHADSVMIAHLVHRKVDPDFPTSLSKIWLQRLRRELGFQGLVVSDDYHMGAIQSRHSLTDIVRLATEAGVDLLMFSNNPLAAPNVQGFKADPMLAKQVQDKTRKELSSGKISKSQLADSIERVERLKRKFFAS